MLGRLQIAVAALALSAVLAGPSALRADSASYEAHYGLIGVGGFIVFFNSQGPLSYVSLTTKELPADAKKIGPVRCRSCQYGLSLPIGLLLGTRNMSVSGAQGNGGIEKALRNLQRDHPALRGIYDVKEDLQQTSVLGVWRRLCTEVSAYGFE